MSSSSSTGFMTTNPVHVIVDNQIDLAITQEVLGDVLTGVLAIGLNTDTLESKIADVINQVSSSSTLNHLDLLNIIFELQQIENNTDDLENKLLDLITNTTGSSTEAKQDILISNLGEKTDVAASSDTGTFSLIAFVKRLLQGITTLNSKDFSTSAKQDVVNTSVNTVNTSIGTTNTNLGARTDSSATTDTGTFSLISLFKRLLEKISTLNTSSTSAKTFKELQYKVQTGEITGRLFMKSGRNPVITSASSPEGMWNGSSLYTGFPTSADEFTITCSLGDVGGTVSFLYLASFTATTYSTHTVTLTGLVTNTGITGVRCHTGFFSTVSGTGFNVGEIVLHQRFSPLNVFFRMPIGRSQTYVACVTVPFNNKGYLWGIFAGVYGTMAVAAEMVMNIDETTSSPRLRRNFVVSNAYPYQDDSLDDSPLTLDATSGIIDVSLRILSTTSVSANTLVGGFNLLLIPNT